MECVKEKRLFLKNIVRFLLLIVVLTFIYFEHKNSNASIKEVITAFNNNQEIICVNKIVSKKRNYDFDKKDSNYISNGENMYLLKNCIIKE